MSELKLRPTRTGLGKVRRRRRGALVGGTGKIGCATVRRWWRPCAAKSALCGCMLGHKIVAFLQAGTWREWYVALSA
jgi:hypothetical protein